MVREAAKMLAILRKQKNEYWDKSKIGIVDGHSDPCHVLFCGIGKPGKGVDCKGDGQAGIADRYLCQSGRSRA